MIGARIKTARKKAGISAEALAAHLGIAPSTVYRYENGETAKLPAMLIKPLADHLNVTPAFLMGWPEEKGDLEHP